MRILRVARREVGFTMVEVLIAMVIALVAVIVMMQVYAVNENYKRTATSGSDAQINGGLALYMLEREIRDSGFNIMPPLQAGCLTARMYNATAGTTSDVRLVPVEIITPASSGVPAADPGTDIIKVTYGNADSFVVGVRVTQASATADFVALDNREGFRAGDLVVGVMPGVGTGGSTQCAFHELTKVPSAVGNCSQGIPAGGSDHLEISTASYKNWTKNCGTQAPAANKGSALSDSGGTTIAAVNYTAGGNIYNLGGAPQAKVFAVRSGSLTVCEWFTQDCTNAANYTVIADNIVSLRVLIGQDFNAGNPGGDGQIRQWSHGTVATANDAAHSVAVAIALVARSGLPEKPTTGTTCDATTTPTKPDKAITAAWHAEYSPQVNTAVSPDIDLSQITAYDYKCYRYKVFQTTVPVRNYLWRPN